MIHIEWWQTTGLILEYSIKLLAIGIVPEGRRPSSSSAWLLAILLVPVVGLPLFLLMGSKHINARRHRVQREANAMIKDVHADFPDIPPGARVTDELLSIIRLNRTLTSMPAVSGESRGVLADYTESLLRMAEAIDSATSYVHMEIYIVAWDNATDEVFRAMERAVQRGVKVRLLFDQVGSWKYPGYRGLGKRLTSIGCRCNPGGGGSDAPTCVITANSWLSTAASASWGHKTSLTPPTSCPPTSKKAGIGLT